MKKSISLVLAMILLASAVLTGCGGKGSDDPNLGTYTAISASMSGVSIDVGDAFGDGFTIELKARGKCEISIDGNSSKGKWTLEKKKFTVSGGGIDCEGTLKKGVMKLENVMGAGIDLTLVNPDHPKYSPENADEGMRDGDGSINMGSFLGDGTDTNGAEGEFEPTVVDKTDIQKYWNGDWYGYMFVSDCGGAFSPFRALSWDAAAIIDVDENGIGNITLWYNPDDEGYGQSYDDPIAVCDIKITRDKGGEHGVGLSMDGWAFGDTTGGHVGDSDWVLEPGSKGDCADELWFGSTFSDGDNYMDYHFCLRPWGNMWEDEKNPLDILIPGFYPWYTKLLNEGWAMPKGFHMDPTQTIDERKSELLEPTINGIPISEYSDSGEDFSVGGSSDGEGSDGSDSGSSAAGESFDNVTPTGSSYTWGNITVNVPDGLEATNGSPGNHDDKDSLDLVNGMKYLLISTKEEKWCKSDIETCKSMNNADDVTFTVNGDVWTGAKYDYSGTPCWQVYTTKGGKCLEVMCYGYDYNSTEALTVFSSVK